MADEQEGGTCAYVARKWDPSNWHGDEPDDWVLSLDAPLGLEQDVWECSHEALDGEEYYAPKYQSLRTQNETV